MNLVAYRSAKQHFALLLALALAMSACALRDVFAAPPSPATSGQTHGDWPYQDLWSGISFNGAKVGFSHVRIVALSGRSGAFRIDSEASLLLQFAGFEKSVRLRATDIVDARLNLLSFDAAYHMDGSDLEVHGRVTDAAIDLDIVNAGRRVTRSIPVSGPVVPTSAALMFPVLHGLEVGRSYRFLSFNSETLSVDEVEQQIKSFGTGDEFAGEAFEIESRLQGGQVISWLDVHGRPLRELALGGLLVTALEDEAEAKRYLVLAAMNKRDVVLDFSTVRVDRRIDDPRRVTQLEFILRGAPVPPPSVPGQRCREVEAGWHCLLDAGPGARDNGDDPRYLRSSLTVPQDDPKIRSLAKQIATGTPDPRARIGRILDWLQANIRQHPADAFSALDVLESRRAECQGHAYLYTALSRALGIPTRVVNGLVYAESRQAFLFHSWAESYVDGAWQAVDPTFSQMQSDATHFRIAEGEEPAELIALTDWVGRLSVELIGYSHGR